MPPGRTELTSDERSCIERVVAALARFNCSTQQLMSEESAQWVKENYPNWIHASLFPLFLASRDSVELTTPSQQSCLLTWKSAKECMDLDRMDAEGLRNAGYLVVGADGGGNFIAVDTNSVRMLEIVLIDAGEYWENGLNTQFIRRTGMEMSQFLNWAYEYPEEIHGFWEKHYGQLPDEN